MELWKTYRPQNFDEVVGQEFAVTALQNMLNISVVPHALLFSGPSGTGKTSLALILSRKLGCNPEDFHSIPCATVESPIEAVREIAFNMRFRSITGGKCKVWLLDEVQSLSRAGFAQQGLLDILENPPEWAYFILATTDPTKIIPTVRNRCTELKLDKIPSKLLADLLIRVAKEEKINLNPAIFQAMVSRAQGSARQALKDLELVSTLKTVDEQLDALQKAEKSSLAYQIFEKLTWKRSGWVGILPLLKQAQNEDQELLRHQILAIARTIMLKGNDAGLAAAKVADAFKFAWYDYPEVGIILACHEILGSGKSV